MIRPIELKRLAGIAVSFLLPLPVAAADSPIRAVSEEVRAYLSPMTLELDLREALALPQGTIWTTDAIKLFSCRGVTFESLRVLVNDKEAQQVLVHAQVKNNSGKDKRITVAFASGNSAPRMVKVVPDQTSLISFTLIQPGPTVRFTTTADDF